MKGKQKKKNKKKKQNNNKKNILLQCMSSPKPGSTVWETRALPLAYVNRVYVIGQK